MLHQLNQRDVEQHVSILGWLLIMAHAVFLLIGAFVFVLLTGIGVAVRDQEALAILGLVGTSVAVLLLLLALPGIVAGVGLLKRYGWARFLTLAVAFLNLINFPVGTAIGLYAIWVLLQDTALDYFSPPRPI